MDKSNDPLFRYTREEKMKMTREEYCALLEERSKILRQENNNLNEQKMPKFNTIEEFMEYYDAIPLDDVVNNLNKLFEY